MKSQSDYEVHTLYSLDNEFFGHRDVKELLNFVEDSTDFTYWSMEFRKVPLSYFMEVERLLDGADETIDDLCGDNAPNIEELSDPRAIDELKSLVKNWANSLSPDTYFWVPVGRDSQEHNYKSLTPPKVESSI